jgi:Secretion system C-terminal sorting domain
MKQLFFVFIFCATLFTEGRATVCYSLSNSGNTLMVSVISSTDYSVLPNNLWVTGNVTLSWPGALGAGVIGTTTGQNGFPFAPDGPAQLDMGTNTYYRKFGFSVAPPVTASLIVGIPVEVMRIVVTHPSIPTGDFSIAPTPPPLVVVNGNASLSNVFAEQYAAGSCVLTATNVPLPVELLSFQAEPQPRTILLHWQSASERNFAGYALQRAEGDLAFADIHWAESKGRALNTYTYEDATVQPGTRYYYRLKMKDTDGSITFSEVRSAMLPVPDNAVRLYPNPAGDFLFVDWGKAEPMRLSVFDIKGRMYIDTNTDWYRLNVSALPPGIYVLKAFDTTQRITTLRFVK